MKHIIWQVTLMLAMLLIAAPMVVRLAHALIAPAVVAVVLYVVVRVTRYFAEP